MFEVHVAGRTKVPYRLFNNYEKGVVYGILEDDVKAFEGMPFTQLPVDQYENYAFTQTNSIGLIQHKNGNYFVTFSIPVFMTIMLLDREGYGQHACSTVSWSGGRFRKSDSKYLVNTTCEDVEDKVDTSKMSHEELKAHFNPKPYVPAESEGYRHVSDIRSGVLDSIEPVVRATILESILEALEFSERNYSFDYGKTFVVNQYGEAGFEKLKAEYAELKSFLKDQLELAYGECQSA